MATRSNIIIKANGHKSVQLYNHYDSYPEGLGRELANFFSEMSDKEQRKILNSTPTALAKKMNFENEGYKINLHADIEYLYVIDLDNEELNCYEVECWDKNGQDMEYINGQITNPEKEKLVYNCTLWQPWDEILLFCWNCRH